MEGIREEGIFTTPVIYPAVPKGQALVRTSYSANHTDEELNLVLAAFQKLVGLWVLFLKISKISPKI